jgi:hypothetical protein
MLDMSFLFDRMVCSIGQYASVMPGCLRPGSAALEVRGYRENAAKIDVRRSVQSAPRELLGRAPDVGIARQIRDIALF